MKKLFIFFLIYCFTVNLANAETCTASNGSWSNAGTWSCGRVPTAGDIAVIPVNITVTVAGNLSSTVPTLNISGTLSFGNGDKLNLPTTAVVNIYSGGQVSGGNGGSTLSVGAVAVYTGGGIPLSGPTTCTAGGCGTLPVSLVSFKAILNNDQSVLLNWETVSEKDSRYFLLNRGNSLDVLHEITRIDAAGQSTTRRSYSFTDIKAPLGTNYYQLSEVANNGIVKSFRPVSVVVEDPNAPFGVFSNPSDNKSFRVKVENAESAILSLFTANGRAITFKITEESETVVIVHPIENLASGVYLLNVKNNGTERTHKIVIE